MTPLQHVGLPHPPPSAPAGLSTGRPVYRQGDIQTFTMQSRACQTALSHAHAVLRRYIANNTW